jgi:signal transduction histidine kinase
MKDLLDKLGSYNIFNYLLPGVLFAAFIDAATSIKIIHKNIEVAVFIYYFLGLVISRVGSLIIEPIAKKTKLVAFSNYTDFLNALKEDPKVELFSEINNMYRTLCSLFLCLLIVITYDKLSAKYKIPYDYSTYVCMFSFFVLFLMSYRKQSTYVTKRISARSPK